MRRGLFGKLAVQNIRNNRSTYIPYMLTCIFCIAMMYMMEFLRDCPTLEKAVPQASEVRLIVGTGEVVVGIFCVIFLIYSNSFLMKRRQKEIGLYNILGLEKGHIGKVMFLETIMTSLLSLAAGIGFGILGSKLSLLLLFRFLHVPAVLGFYVSITGILFCIAGFGGIFLVILALNLTRVRMNNPVELLKGGNTGEREPRAKWLMAFLGVICLGVGYYLAVTTESPIQAIFIFLLAVILVMAGTYLLFTAGSIVILKLLRKNKKFYYKTSNFISVSGMIYRMKQNAAGLASICILSTGVLLLLSMTVSLYFGMGDIMVNRYPFDTDAQISGISQEQSEQFQKVFAQAIEDYQVPAEKTVTETYLEIGCKQGKNGIMIGQAYSYSEDGNSVDLYTIRQSEYEKLTGEKTDLHDGEIFAWYPSERETDTLKIDDWDFAVKKWLEKAPLIKEYMPYTVELGRSFVSLEYQNVRTNTKSIFALDNLWDGLGALTVLYPEVKYFFGKMTMYPSYIRRGRDMILYFLKKHFDDKENLVIPMKPLKLDTPESDLAAIFTEDDFKADYRILNREVRKLGYNIPPLVNAYMSLSPTMKLFGTAINYGFGDVEETGILIAIDEILEEKRVRHINSFIKEHPEALKITSGANKVIYKEKNI